MADQSKKKDAGKPRLDLLDDDAIEGVARVLGFGAEKYQADGWRAGMEWRRLIGAARRHLAAFARGEDIDPESGLPHLDHLGCCWMFLSAYQKQRVGTDDRYKTHYVPDVAPDVVVAPLVETLRIPPEQLDRLREACRVAPATTRFEELGITDTEHAYGNDFVVRPLSSPEVSREPTRSQCTEVGCLRPPEHTDWHSDGELAWQGGDDVRTVADPTEVLP